MSRTRATAATLILLGLALGIAIGTLSCTCRRPSEGGGTEEGLIGPSGGTESPLPGSDEGAAGTAGGAAGSAEGGTAGAEGAPAAGSGQAPAKSPSAPAAKAPAAPVFGADPGPHAGDIQVEIKAEAGTTVRYSLDGSVPGPKGGSPYSGPVALSSSATLTAVAFRQGKPSKPAVRTFTIREICVSPGASGPGGRDRPSGSIAQAIASAEGLGIGEIRLASGEYRESAEIGSAISLSGGWAAGFAKRDGSGTVIVGSLGGEKADAPRAAVIASGPRASVTLTRVELRGGQAAYSAGLFLKDGAQAYLTDCVLSGGSGTYSYAARLTGKSNASFSACRLDGGSAENCVGLSLDSSSARLVRSRAAAGSGTVLAYGAQCTSSGLLAASSVISGGNANQSYGAGIYASKDVSLLGCTVYGGDGANCYAVFSSQSSPAVKGCLIGSRGSKKSYGVYENYGVSSLSALQGNAFWGSSSGIYFDIETKTAYAGVNASGAPAEGDKAVSTPKASGNWVWAGSLGADLATPQDPALASGGMALDDIAAVDAAGKKRSAPWSVGAFELD